jgi:hypothetical protein
VFFQGATEAVWGVILRCINGDAAISLFLLLTTSLPFPVHDQSGTASRFGDPGDKWIGGTLKCAPDKYVDSQMRVCAHRSYACGTVLVIENSRTGMKTWCRVMDRGPYGANVFADDGQLVYISGAPAWYVKKTRSQRPPRRLCGAGGCVGRWRGILDMSPAVSDAIRHNGLERVKVWRLSKLLRWYRSRPWITRPRA